MFPKAGGQYVYIRKRMETWWVSSAVSATVTCLPPVHLYAPLSDKNILYEIGISNSMRLRLFLYFHDYFVELQ
jgi:hypothetical protein